MFFYVSRRLPPGRFLRFPAGVFLRFPAPSPGKFSTFPGGRVLRFPAPSPGTFSTFPGGRFLRFPAPSPGTFSTFPGGPAGRFPAGRVVLVRLIHVLYTYGCVFLDAGNHLIPLPCDSMPGFTLRFQNARFHTPDSSPASYLLLLVACLRTLRWPDTQLVRCSLQVAARPRSTS